MIPMREATMRTCRSTSFALIVALLTAVLLATRADVPASALSPRISVPIVGTVDGRPESVALAGTIEIANMLVTDTNGGSPKERLSLKLVGVTGAGVVSGAKYVASGEENLVRPLAASDHIEVMFPFFRATADGPLSARSVAASIVFNFDLLTGAITKATASFSTPKVLAR
jgi:hypothetical protein